MTLNHPRLVALLVGLCSLLAPLARGEEPKSSAQLPSGYKPTQKWAILIGVDKYSYIKKLNYCGKDMAALRTQLVASGFDEKQVYLLSDKAEDTKFLPSKANIERQVDLLLKLVDREDVVLLAFSGHGVHFGEQSYLCPTDAKLDEIKETMVSLDGVYDKLKECPAALKIVMVDACRNDPRLGGQKSAADTAADNEQFAQPLERVPQGTLMFNSCSPGETSMEDDKLGHGVFTHFVLGGLQGDADEDRDRVVTLHELMKYTSRSTKKYVADKYADLQRPYWKGDTTLEALEFDIGRLAKVVIPEPKPTPLSEPGENVKPGEVITNGIGMKLAAIPAGEFLMGSPESELDDEDKHSDDERQHRVRITRPFYLGVYEVTQEEYARVMGKNPSFFSSTGEGKATVAGLDTRRCPVEQVSWEEAMEFCERLSLKEGKGTYRLPTEAEWEYACRAGTETPFHFGAKLNGEQANCAGNFPYGTRIKGKYLERTTTVGRYKANGFGLYDLHGNVWEWCSDGYSSIYYDHSPGNDPPGWAKASYRVIRGGSWTSKARLCRSANRFKWSPGARDSDLGFRVAWVPADE